MNESENRPQQNDSVSGNNDPATVNSLVADLASNDGLLRVKARRSLVAIGGQAAGPLVEALTASNQWVRWEAAKALGQIGDPAAAQALVGALEDKMFDVRWLAAEGLIIIGRDSLSPLLQALLENSDSVWLREGAHHVLHDLAQQGFADILQPVLVALEDIDASVEVPLAAKTALRNLA